jgi:hypothetical protein
MLADTRRRVLLGAICTLLMSALLLSSGAVQAEPFKRTASGWINQTEVDPNGNGIPLNSLTAFGKGTFGQSASNDVGETGSFAGEFCEFFPPDIVVIRLPILSRSSIIRFANGDLLYATLATDGLPSSLCIDVRNGTRTVEIYMVISGGTGKFDGATGDLLVTGSSTPVSTEAGFPVHIAVTQVTKGEVYLQDDD